MAPFLVWHDEDGAIAEDLRLALDRFELRPGLFLVDSELDLSPLYHRIKRALPPGSPLLVAPLAAPPKFKRMEEGALKWLRAHSASPDSLGSTTWISTIPGNGGTGPAV
jgi:hypothetical protein